ncbi:hypothetical protein JW968_05250 [Candidatus Woesearchaeota archaeon]|nr:hypothetical protein [Candidatus Woesearchaeota archaeon]
MNNNIKDYFSGLLIIFVIAIGTLMLIWANDIFMQLFLYAVFGFLTYKWVRYCKQQKDKKVLLMRHLLVPAIIIYFIFVGITYFPVYDYQMYNPGYNQTGESGSLFLYNLRLNLGNFSGYFFLLFIFIFLVYIWSDKLTKKRVRKNK